MRAAILRELGKPLMVEEVELPQLSEGQVLMRMQLAAVCHSQKLEVSGGRGPDRFLPHLIGHEGVGLVIDVGPGVTKVRTGHQAVLSWIRGSGRACGTIRYTSKTGPVNAGPIATFCEMPIVSEQCLTPIDPPLAPEMAVLAGCALPTGAGSVWNAVPSNVRGSLCVLGMGGVGLSAVAGAVHAGWKQIVAIDLHKQRLIRALDLGATDTINASQTDVENAAATLTEGRGFDLVVECAGTTATMETAVRLAKTKGGKVVIVGNLEAGKKINIDPFNLIEGRTLEGSWGGGINPDVDILKIVRLVERSAIKHRPLLGKRFKLDQVNEAIQTLSSEEPGRPLIEFSGA